MKHSEMLNYLRVIPQLDKNIFYGLNTDNLNLGINKTHEIILMCIKDYPEKSMNEISRLVGLEKSSFTRSVSTLEKIGYITKYQNEKDKRIFHTILTEKGKEASIKIDIAMDNYLDNIFSLFSKDERDQIKYSLKIISEFSAKLEKNLIKKESYSNE